MGSIHIDDNDALTSLTVLENLTSIGGELWIVENNALTSLSGLESLSSIGGDLNIDDNWVLISLSGLESLASIGGNLYIWHNALTSLSGLNSLTSIDGDLWIEDNFVLTSLSGLDSLHSIGGNLRIGDHNVLTSLIGLENIDAVSISNLYIYGNELLSTCDVKSICDYLANPNGLLIISNNATGCNNPGQVQAACLETSVQELSSEENFTITPNPLESTTSITYTLQQNSPVTLKILDLSGGK